MENKTRINVPTINADDIIEKSALARVQELDGLINNMVDSLSKASNGKNLSKYWKNQDELIQDVIKSHKEFNKVANDVNASNLLKVVNALKAMHGVDLSDIIPNFNEIEKSMQSAKRIVGSLDSAFDVSSFKSAFSAFETLKVYGLDLENFFKHFEFNADVDKLVSELNNANDAVSNLKSKVTQLEDKLEESESGNGIRAVREECENLRWEIERIRDEAAETFSAFLTSNNINADSYQYEEFFERIREGSLTAQEAIAEFKRDYSHLLEGGASFDTAQLQDFSRRLDDVLKRITDVSEKIDYISSNGVRVSDFGGSDSGNFEELANVVNQIENTNINGSTSAIYESLSKILTAIKEIGQCDTDNLYHLYSTIRNLAQLNDLKVNKASLDNLADCLERICRIDNSSALTNLSLVNFKNFNDLHISKASLNNLAEYLPQISNIDVGTLTALASLDFDKLNSLHIDKDSMKNLFSFVEGLRNATGLTDFTTENKNVESSADASTGSLKTEAELMESIATNAEKAAKAKKEFVEANKELTKATETSATALSKENGELGEMGNKSNISSPIKDTFQGEKIQETVSIADKLEEEIQEITVATDKAGKALEEYKEKWKVLKQVGDVGDDKYSATFEKNAGQIESVVWKAKRDADGNVLFDSNGEKEYEMLSVTISNYQKLESVIVSADNELRKLEDRRQNLLKQNPTASTSGLDAQITYQKNYISLLEQTVKHISQADEYLLEEQQIIEARNKAEKEYQLTKGSKQDESVAKDYQKRNDAITKANRLLNTQEKTVEHIAKTYDKALNPDLEKSVNNPNDLAELAQKKSEIQTLINQLKNAPRDTSNEQEYLRLEKLIAEYKDLADYKKKANNPTKQELGGQKLETLVAQTVAEYDKLIIRAEKYGDATKEIVEKLRQQRDLLAQTDTNGKYTANANNFYSARDVLKVQKADFGVFEASEKAIKIREKELEAVRKLSAEKQKLQEKDRQSTVDSALKDQLSAWKGIQNIREKIAKTTNEEELSILNQQKKNAQQQYLSAEKVLKANVDLYDNEARLSEMEKIRLETNRKLASYGESQVKAINDLVNSNQAHLDKLRPTEGNRSIDFEKAVQEYNKAIIALREFHATLDSSTPLTKEQSAKYEKLSTSLREARVEMEKFSASEKGSMESSRWKEIDKITKYLEKNTKISKTAKQQLEAFIDTLKNVSGVNVEDIHMQFNKIAEAERRAGREGKRFWDILTDKAVYGAAAQLAGYYLSLTDFIRYAQNGIQTIRELDTALTEMRKVSDESVDSLKKFQDVSFDLADDVGTTAKQIQNSTADWMRLGRPQQKLWTAPLYGNI